MQDVLSPKPFYENDFSNPDRWLGQTDSGKGFSVREGRFVMLVPDLADRWAYHGKVPLIEAADMEVVGRASQGSWGVTLMTPQLPAFGIELLVDAGGGIRARRFVRLTSESSSFSFTPMQVHPLRLTKWNGEGGFNTLRAVARDGHVDVWLNGEPACEPIQLLDPLPVLNIFLAGYSGEQHGLECEFESLRVWRAGVRPLPQAKAEAIASASAAKPIYENQFTAWTDSFRPATGIYTNIFSLRRWPVCHSISEMEQRVS